MSIKIKANDSKSDLAYLNKLVDQYNNTYHHSIGKKAINADYSALTENNWDQSESSWFSFEN